MRQARAWRTAQPTSILYPNLVDGPRAPERLKQALPKVHNVGHVGGCSSVMDEMTRGKIEKSERGIPT